MAALFVRVYGRVVRATAGNAAQLIGAALAEWNCREEWHLTGLGRTPEGRALLELSVSNGESSGLSPSSVGENPQPEPAFTAELEAAEQLIPGRRLRPWERTFVTGPELRRERVAREAADYEHDPRD